MLTIIFAFLRSPLGRYCMAALAIAIAAFGLYKYVRHLGYEEASGKYETMIAEAKSAQAAKDAAQREADTAKDLRFAQERQARSATQTALGKSLAAKQATVVYVESCKSTPEVMEAARAIAEAAARKEKK